MAKSKSKGKKANKSTHKGMVSTYSPEGDSSQGVNGVDGSTWDTTTSEYRSEYARAPKGLKKRWKATLKERVRESPSEVEKQVNKGDFHLYVVSEDIKSSLKRAFDFEPSRITGPIHPEERALPQEVDSEPPTGSIIRPVQPEDTSSSQIVQPPAEIDYWIFTFGGESGSTEWDTLVVTQYKEVQNVLKAHRAYTIRSPTGPQPHRVEARALRQGRTQEALVATCNIAPGGLIISERPMLVLDASTPLGILEILDHGLQQQPWLELYNKIARMVTANCPPGVLGESVNLIALAHSIFCYNIPVQLDEECHVTLCGVFDIISRGCLSSKTGGQPNAAYYFNPASFCGELFAVRPIRAGERLVVALLGEY